MKTTRLIICLLIAVFAGTSYSYGQYRTTKANVISRNNIKFKNYNYVLNFSHGYEGDNETYYISKKMKIQFPVAIKGYRDISHLQKKIFNFAGNDDTDSLSELLAKLSTCNEYNAKAIKSIPKNLSNFHTSEESTEITFVKTLKNILIFKRESFWYSAGAAHGMYDDTYLNYSIKDNNIIKIENLIYSNHFYEVRSLIKNNLSVNPELILQFKNDQSIDNFIINSNSITFIFNPYEVACYAAGVVTAEIPFSSLYPYLTDYGKSLIK